MVEDSQLKPFLVRRTGAPHILVVEDEAKDQTWLTEIIAGARYNVEVAGTGAKALALCGERTFDGITLDLILPDMNGWDVLRKIREDGLNRTTPVIVVTVIADKSAAIGFRVNEFLVKPVKDSDLIAAMKRAGIVQGRSKEVLCIDNDPGSLKLAKTVLRSGGDLPTCKTDSRAALKYLEKKQPAAIVLDLTMPGMDGFEFLERFRRIKDSHRIPVIVWTIKDLTNEDRRRLQASVQAIVLKGRSTIAQLLEELAVNIGRSEPEAKTGAM